MVGIHPVLVGSDQTDILTHFWFCSAQRWPLPGLSAISCLLNKNGICTRGGRPIPFFWVLSL